MLELICNQPVCLTKDLDELSLPRGSVGIVRGTWEYPNCAYEVEFPVGASTLRLLLLEGQVRRCANAERDQRNPGRN